MTLLVFPLSEHNSNLCVFLFCQSGTIMLIYVCECFLISLMFPYAVLYWFGLSIGPVCSGQVSVWLSNSPGNYSILVLLQVYVILMFSRVFHSRTFFLFYIGVCRSGFQIMLNFPVFFISREKKYLGFPPRENVKKPLFSFFLENSRYALGIKLRDSKTQNDIAFYIEPDPLSRAKLSFFSNFF